MNRNDKPRADNPSDAIMLRFDNLMAEVEPYAEAIARRMAETKKGSKNEGTTGQSPLDDREKLLQGLDPSDPLHAVCLRLESLIAEVEPDAEVIAQRITEREQQGSKNEGTTDQGPLDGREK